MQNLQSHLLAHRCRARQYGRAHSDHLCPRYDAQCRVAHGAAKLFPSYSFPQSRQICRQLIRSYAGSWGFLTQFISEDPWQDNQWMTGVQIFTSTSQANILWLRVSLWVSPNLIFTLSGILFLVIQSTWDQRQSFHRRSFPGHHGSSSQTGSCVMQRFDSR